MVEEQDKQQPSLELPSLFGRRKRRGKGTTGDDGAPVPVAEPVASEPEPVAEPEPAHEPEPATSPEPAFAPEPAEPAEPSGPTQPAAARDRTNAVPVVADIGAPPPDDAPAESPEPLVLPVEAPAARAERPAVESLPAGTPLFVDEPVEPEPERESEPALPTSDVLLAQQAPVELDEPEPTRRERRRRPAVPQRLRSGYPAAALVGLLVGVLLVGLTAGALRGCEAVRGTATCGGGVGISLLVVILALLVVLGGVLLRVLGVPDPTSTSFLAVGVVAVVCLLFLVEALLSPWMILVLPVLSVGAYLLAQWVTTAFVEVD